MTLKEMGAPLGALDDPNQVVRERAEYSGAPLDLQARARIARALRIRIQGVLQERGAKARQALKLEEWYRAQQSFLLDQIDNDNLILSRMRSLVHRLEFGVAP